METASIIDENTLFSTIEVVGQRAYGCLGAPERPGFALPADSSAYLRLVLRFGLICGQGSRGAGRKADEGESEDETAESRDEGTSGHAFRIHGSGAAGKPLETRRLPEAVLQAATSEPAGIPTHR
jgi:hypothetical protein